MSKMYPGISDERITQLIDIEQKYLDLEVGVAEALTVAEDFGQTDGAHHKTWTIDQMVRALLITDERYNDWVAAAKDGEEGPETYE